MAPVAIGSQTAGSVIRPASFCGVVGMKPTHGLVPLDGVSPFAPSLDTAGLFAREVADLAPLLAALGVGSGGPAPAAGPPSVGLCRTEQWPLAEPSSRAAVERAAALLAGAGVAVEEVELGPAFAGLAEAERTIMAAEAAQTFRELRTRHRDRMSPVLRDFLEAGAATPPARLAAARAQAERCRALLPALFARTDVLLTPSAPGEAPAGLASTGDPAMNRIWTLLGVPCLSLPGATGPAGMPVGVQLVGPAGGDGALVAAAAFVEERLRPTGAP
jgi:amidase